MRAKYDISSKWLIEHYAAAMLKLAGVGPVARARPLPGEVVQTRQLPDGLVEARITGRTDPVLCLIEVSTYPYSAVPEALLDDIALTYLDRRVIPEVVTLVLRERGNVRVDSSIRLASPLGTTRLKARGAS